MGLQRPVWVDGESGSGLGGQWKKDPHVDSGGELGLA